MISLIREKCRSLYIADFGIVRARVFGELSDFLEKCGHTPMTTPDIRRRTDPFLIMPEAKSIIVCLMSYYTGDEKGNLSKYARGEDYHSVMGRALGELAELLKENGYRAEGFCDSGDLNDRYLAYLAGLGFFGKNGFLIHPVYGTYTVIGYIITDCPLDESAPLNSTCINCGECVRRCPGGAIAEDGSFCYEKCASYITQKKGELSSEEERIIAKSGYVWGCDVCQDVCPHNKNAKKTKNPEFNEYLCKDLHIDTSISNRTFRKVYKNKAYAWRGKGVIARNQEILEKKGK